jgi:syntaxin-binding protein 1
MSQFNPYRKAIADDDPDCDFQGSRYTPLLKSILEDVCSKTLSIEDYPSVLPMPEDAYMQPTTGKGSVTSSRKGKAGVSSGAAASLRKGSGATSRWTASTVAISTTGNKKAGGATYISGPRIIVFIVGGASYAELRTCRDITDQEGREVIVGSTALLSPQEFIEDLKKLQQQSNA